VGDQLLVEVAQRLTECVRHSDTVARLGGDEFVVMLVDLSTDERQAAWMAERIGEKILARIHAPCAIQQRVIRSGGSIGLCLFSGEQVSIDDVFKRADMSMYQAKASGRNALRFFDPEIQVALEARMALESELHEALTQEQLRLYFQVQIDSDRRVMGAEVLLRWEHPRLGLVAPDAFIPIAEESGLIVPIGEWVLRNACEQLRAWQRDPVMRDFVLSVNVSARQFRQPDFVETVQALLAQTRVDASRLKLELTESLVLHNVDDTVVKMRALNVMGLEFSMDDFGTGYSSLAHLTNLSLCKPSLAWPTRWGLPSSPKGWKQKHSTVAWGNSDAWPTKGSCMDGRYRWQTLNPWLCKCRRSRRVPDGGTWCPHSMF
jgi:predicted signal transduction protein with EAL and GGDEF domain